MRTSSFLSALCRLILVAGVYCFPQMVIGQINVLRYDIHLDFVDLKTKTLQGHTDLHARFTPSGNIKGAKLVLDLLAYDVKSVKMNGAALKFERKDSLLTVHIPDKMATDTFTVRIQYGGKPADPSWFGGVYFTDTLVYNLGVQIEGHSHSHGKAWFPCRDIFDDKANFRYWITVPQGMAAVCNGSLKERKKMPDGRERFHWVLRDPISPYLASFAVGNYIEVKDSWKSQSGTIPISIWVPPAYEAKTRGSFVHLKSTLSGFEERFGPYAWERVGYVGVPMKAGAMEHATNIAYPLNAIDGTDRMDRLWAHELAHSWFGNSVTCSGPESMWLNEGFARWCEALYTELRSGPEAYTKYMQDLQHKVLEETAIKDGGWYAVGDVPTRITYGSTVYDKGALVVHSLRSWLGDSAFYSAIKLYMQKNQYDLANNMTIQQSLEEASGAKLDDFFQVWVLNPGFVHYAITNYTATSTSSAKGNLWNMECQTRQMIFHGSTPMSDTRTAAWVVGETADKVFKTKLDVSNNDIKQTLTGIPFKPKGIILDPEQSYSDAAIDQVFYLSQGDTALLKDIDNCRAVVTRAAGSRLIQLRYNYVGQQDVDKLPVRNIGNRYWSLDGNIDEADAVFFVIMTDVGELFPPNVRAEHAANSGNLATALFYRPRTGGPWQELLRYPGFMEGVRMIFPVPDAEAGDYSIAVVPVK